MGHGEPSRRFVTFLLFVVITLAGKYPASELSVNFRIPNFCIYFVPHSFNRHVTVVCVFTDVLNVIEMYIIFNKGEHFNIKSFYLHCRVCVDV